MRHAPASPDDLLEGVSRCLFCGAGEASIAIEGVRDLFFKADAGEFAFAACASCESLWLTNRPVGERLLAAYASYYTHAAPPRESRGLVRDLARALYLKSRLAQPAGLADRLLGVIGRTILPDSPGLDHHFRFAPKAPARVLDYGCGSGAYLLRMAPFGHTLVGAEYDPGLLGALAERGIAIKDVAGIDDQAWQGTFDHITLAHVIEHVPDPLALLGRLYGFLKPGGTLFIEVPNAKATGLAIFGRYWRGLEAPRHFALPTRAALITALEGAGFVIVRQNIDHPARGWVWAASRSVAPAHEAEALDAAMKAAPAETETNAEFLTFVARKPV